jgi:hypothetical protein
MNFFKRLPFELLIWIGVLLYLLLINPAAEHTSFCFYKFIGISWCPGCGIGHSISFALHGDFSASLQSHKFGIIALLILLHRIYILFINHFNIQTNTHPKIN